MKIPPNVVLGYLAWLVAGVCPLAAIDLPAGALEKLGSEEFRSRENAQAELLTWARENREPAMDELLRISGQVDDPEISQRCLGVLRELVMDDFWNEGEGYMGISMAFAEVITNVPGDPVPRSAVQVNMVMPNSAAAEAGILVGDLIVGLNDQVWHAGPANENFTKEIRKFKPRTKVTLKVKRKEEFMDVVVTLKRRPPIPERRSFDEPEPDLEALQKAEMDAHFKEWLTRKKTAK